MAGIEMATHEDAKAGTAAAAPLLVDLQDDAVQGHGVIAGHDALFLMTQDLLQVVGAEGDEGRGGIRRGTAERPIVVGDEMLGQVAVGLGHGADAGDAEFVDEAALQGAVSALAAAAGLGGVPQDVLDVQVGQGPPDLGRLGAIRRGAGGGGVGGPAWPTSSGTTVVATSGFGAWIYQRGRRSFEP